MLTFNDLINHFYNSIVPESENKIGTEYELICLNKKNLKRPGYNTNPGIKDILEIFLEKTNSIPIYEGKNIIALKNNDYSITLEPGGQFEASFSPCKTITELEKKLNNYLKILKEVENLLDVYFIGFGVDPINKLEEVEWIPKKRYQIMSKYLFTKGSMTHYMMKQTASIQVNIDYNSEKDAIEKIKNASKLYDILSSMFSNSSIYDSEYKGTSNFRSIIWKNNDPDRSGIPLYKGKEIKSFEDYTNYALDIPIMFIYKNHEYYEINGKITFRDFLKHGFSGIFPDIKDWILHLNTIFPIVRFNNSNIEIRMFDSNKPDIVLTISAIIKGIFYNKILYDNSINSRDIIQIAENNLLIEEKHYLKQIKNIIEKNTSFGNLAYHVFKKSNIFDFIEYLKI